MKRSGMASRPGVGATLSSSSRMMPAAARAWHCVLRRASTLVSQRA
eukprot:CAMPEP_0174858616 /NCGR_PEP_ID=MMETSP1114-20130205/43341_1 /TAXON_ID=312471 /ORGANISM="Neobodo designis, Strain CCAP 1951/1" /LENGTH=45 /DNA_ID= /DNA_START= /DNA_END= /DNA_ORIENTATION=